jgi:hypothetical protein
MSKSLVAPRPIWHVEGLVQKRSSKPLPTSKKPRTEQNHTTLTLLSTLTKIHRTLLAHTLEQEVRMQEWTTPRSTLQLRHRSKAASSKVFDFYGMSQKLIESSAKHFKVNLSSTTQTRTARSLGPSIILELKAMARHNLTTNPSSRGKA